MKQKCVFFVQFDNRKKKQIMWLKMFAYVIQIERKTELTPFFVA